MSSSATGDESETLQVSTPSDAPPTAIAPPGALISRYVVIEEVGLGGMGRVLRTYDPKLQREVALKEVRMDADGRSGSSGVVVDATRRLVAEARAMAKLSHPNVVAVYDVEEVGRGQVVLVMEFVAGQTLRSWLRAEDRSWPAVIDRFVEAGRGLAAAHEAGLLHRDFKPANVLVADGGVVKVTDFGLAKAPAVDSGAASSEGLGSAEDLTEAGLVMGTPRYMAPEQHVGRTLGPAADQYAFCVALWEALCGEPPFSGETMARDKFAGPPSWTRSDSPRPIAQAIARGLAPKPEDRWPSMEALLEALAWDPRGRRNRWLLGVGGVLLLGLGGVAYQAWADARAQRCSGGEARLAGIWDDARRQQVHAAFAAIDKSYADAAWTRTQQALDTYADQWAAMHSEACEATTIRGEQSPQMLDLRMACLSRAAVDLDSVVDVLADADAEVVQRAHEVTAGLRSVARCADAEALTAEVEPPAADEAETVEAARAQLARSRSLIDAGRYDDARTAVEAAKTALEVVSYAPVWTEVALAEGLVLYELGEYPASEAALQDALRDAAVWGQRDLMRQAAVKLMDVVGSQQERTDDGLRYRPLAEGLSKGDPEAEAVFRTNLGSVLATKGEFGEAEVELRAALDSWETVRGPEDPVVAMTRNNLANVLDAQGKYAEAEAEHRALIALRESTLGPDHPQLGVSHNNLAVTLGVQGKFEEAEAELRAALDVWIAALGPDHPLVRSARSNLGLALEGQGRFADAEAEHRDLLALREATLGPEHHEVAASHNNLANVLHRQGKYAEAEREHRSALAIHQALHGPDHPDVATDRNNLAGDLRAQGKYAEAEAETRAALAIREAMLGPEHPDTAMTRNNLALLFEQQGKYVEAEAEHRAVLALREAILSPDHPHLGQSHANLGIVLRRQGKYAEAEAELRAGLTIWEAALGDDNPKVAMARHNLAAVLVDLERSTEALPLAERAWARRRQQDIPPGERAESAWLLSRILWSIDEPDRDRARARTLARDALDGYETAGVEHEAEIRDLRQWLESHDR